MNMIESIETTDMNIWKENLSATRLHLGNHVLHLSVLKIDLTN